MGATPIVLISTDYGNDGSRADLTLVYQNHSFMVHSQLMAVYSDWYRTVASCRDGAGSTITINKEGKNFDGYHLRLVLDCLYRMPVDTSSLNEIEVAIHCAGWLGCMAVVEGLWQRLQQTVETHAPDCRATAPHSYTGPVGNGPPDQWPSVSLSRMVESIDFAILHGKKAEAAMMMNHLLSNVVFADKAAAAKVYCKRVRHEEQKREVRSALMQIQDFDLDDEPNEMQEELYFSSLMCSRLLGCVPLDSLDNDEMAAWQDVVAEVLDRNHEEGAVVSLTAADLE